MYCQGTLSFSLIQTVRSAFCDLFILGNPGVVHREGENSGPTQKSRAVSTTPGDIVLQSLFWASAGVLARDWAQISAIVFCALSATKEFYRCDGATKPFPV